MAKAIHRKMIEQAGSVSPALADALVQNGAVSLQTRWDTAPFVDVLCRSVAGQQLSVRAAATIWGRVSDKMGDRAAADYFLRCRATTLRGCGLSEAKARAMREIAQASKAGDLDREMLKTLDSAERAKHLTQIWGVGQWTADMASIFYFGDKDVWPDGDVTARKTLARLTSARRKTVRTAENFAPYRSYLAIHMWRYANAKPVS